MASYQDLQRRPQQNLLLHSLEETSARNLFAQMDLVPLPIGKILQEPGIAAQHVYFPTTCVVSLLCGIENGSAAEVAIVGNEGVVGAMNIIGGDASPIQAVVQSTGYAYRIRASLLRQEFQSNSELQALLLKYMHVLMTQMAQTAVCNRHHTLDQQLCRWFLHCLDRLPGNELIITQEFIAQMLGVRREGVTAAAGKLQKAGVINYRRGRITIVDRAGLEAQACECYDIVRKEYQRLLPAQKQPAANIQSAIPSVTPGAGNQSTASDWRNAPLNPQYAVANGSTLDRVGERA